MIIEYFNISDNFRLIYIFLEYYYDFNFLKYKKYLNVLRWNQTSILTMERAKNCLITNGKPCISKILESSLSRLTLKAFTLLNKAMEGKFQRL